VLGTLPLEVLPMPSDREIRLVVADDHEVIRQGVMALLADSEIKVVAGAVTEEHAVQLALENEIDVVLLDVHMPDGDGLKALRRIKVEKPDLPVLIFSVVDNPGTITKAVALGASGCLLKACAREELLLAIRTVAAGGTYGRTSTAS